MACPNIDLHGASVPPGPHLFDDGLLHCIDYFITVCVQSNNNNNIVIIVLLKCKMISLYLGRKIRKLYHPRVYVNYRRRNEMFEMNAV